MVTQDTGYVLDELYRICHSWMCRSNLGVCAVLHVCSEVAEDEEVAAEDERDEAEDKYSDFFC